MKKIFIRIWLLIFAFSTFLIGNEKLRAFNDYKINFGETKTIKSEYGTESVDINGANSKTKVTIEITNVSVFDGNGNPIDDTIIVAFFENEEKEWSVRSGGTLVFTEYVDEYVDTLRFSSNTHNNFSLDLKVTKISGAELTISCHKPITMKDTDLKKVHVSVYYGDEDVSEYAEFKVKSSKKYLVDIDTSDSDLEDYFYLSGNYKAGKCKITVTAKYKGQTCKDTFTLNVVSTLKNYLFVFGELYNYNTRTNVFSMSLMNRSRKKITIYSKGAVALDEDYVSFDRDVKITKNKKSITIKPGQSKVIHWKVVGNTTWYKVDDFEIHFKCKYKGKVHWLSVQNESVYIWKNKKWKLLSDENS